MEQIVNSGEFKLVDLVTAKYVMASLKEKGKKIVFTNGCFDMLHAGHLASFLQARKFGDVLVAAVNSDASVKRLKGEERPIVEQTYRLRMLCALECIDYVILMEDDTPVRIIQELKPDVTVKGKDWEHKDIPERRVVESYGGEVKFIDLEGGLSTTSLIGKIKHE
jgi:rfaE bifunctional protein nucleotidyltransferase chain/domain